MFAKFLLPILLATSLISAKEISSEEVPTSLPAVTSEGKPPKLYHYNNRMVVFNLVRLCYERTKPDALYVGIDAWITGAFTNKTSPYNRSNSYTAIGQIELLFGHNYLFSNRHHLTPIGGIGVFKDFSSYSYTEYYYDNYYSYSYRRHFHLHPIIYGAVGGLYSYDFNSVFNLGFKLKGLFGGVAGGKSWGNPVFGVNASVPITLRFGRHRHWDFCLEPFNTYFNGRYIDKNYFGFQLAFGYRF